MKALRDMEEFTRDVGGYPFLYADIFMTREEFDDMFDTDMGDATTNHQRHRPNNSTTTTCNDSSTVSIVVS